MNPALTPPKLTPVRNFRKRLVLIITSFALFSACDEHKLLLQSIAWVKMAYTFSHRDSVKVAVEKTFNGKHPCEICKHLRKRTGEPKLTASTWVSFEKILSIMGRIRLLRAPKPIVDFICSRINFPEELYFDPLSPPPKSPLLDS